VRPPLAPVRILVADPDEVSARQLELALMAEPNVDVVGWAGSCDRTLELASTQATDVVLLAVNLPAAPETLDRLVKLVPKAPDVILMGDERPRGDILNGVGLTGFASRTGEVAGFVRKTTEITDMVTLVVALVALANVPSGELNGSTP